MIEPTWITEARAQAAQRDAYWAEQQRQREAEDAARERQKLTDALEHNGVPVARATITRDHYGRWVAEVDGYRFIRPHDAYRVIRRLLACPTCTQEVTSDQVASGSDGDLGALLDTTAVAYHRCPGRPVGPEDYDEDGELIGRTPRMPPLPPSVGETLLAALATYIAEQGAGE